MAGVFHFESSRWLQSMDIYGAASAAPMTGSPLLISDPRSTLLALTCLALPPGGETMAWFSSRQDSSFGNADIFWTSKLNIQQPD